tara:strand:- start:100 stop:711 length:612 start_codon:yes stop_codon:yes gene_type:complete
MQFSDLINFAISLFAITNAFGNLPIFLSLTQNKSETEQRKIAIKASLSVAIILLIVTFIGKGLLGFFGIAIYSFEIAGSIIIFLTGLSLIQDHSVNKETTDEEHTNNVAVVPLAIPIVVGPGAITTVTIFARKFDNPIDLTYISITCLILSFIIGLLFYFAPKISSIIKEEGMQVLSRIMGLILAGIACQLFINGIKTAFLSG